MHLQLCPAWEMGVPAMSVPAEGRMPVAPCELGWGVPEEVAPGTSHHKARHLPRFPQSHLLKVAPCWQGAPETQGSCWPLGQTPILGSNTLVAGQMLSMSDPNRAPCPMQGRDHVQLLVLPCALMVLGPAASEPEQLKAALKGCSEVGGGGGTAHLGLLPLALQGAATEDQCPHLFQCSPQHCRVRAVTQGPVPGNMRLQPAMCHSSA